MPNLRKDSWLHKPKIGFPIILLISQNISGFTFLKLRPNILQKPEVPASFSKIPASGVKLKECKVNVLQAYKTLLQFGATKKTRLKPRSNLERLKKHV